MIPRKGILSFAVLYLIAPQVCPAAGIPAWKGGKATGEDRTATSLTACDAISVAEAEVQRYLQSSLLTSVVPTGFHVQGWRWHTMSLIREARRLQQDAVRLHAQLPQQSNDESMNALHTVAEYCVDFNLKGLHRIEKDLFFPWLRSKASMFGENAVARSFETVVDQLEQDRQRIETLGKSLMSQASIVACSANSLAVRSTAIDSIANDAASIADAAQAMLKREEFIVIPSVAQLVSEKEQKSFNNRVIQKLGLLDSRLHLVGMHEAVLENDVEHQLFKQTIPMIPQRMIPRWKRLIYEPRARAMDRVWSS